MSKLAGRDLRFVGLVERSPPDKSLLPNTSCQASPRFYLLALCVAFGSHRGKHGWHCSHTLTR